MSESTNVPWYNFLPGNEPSAIEDEILRIEQTLAGGVTSVTVDGTSTVINHDHLRQRLKELRRRLPWIAAQRPVASNIYLGGF